MIYQLVNYLKTKFPTVSFYANVFYKKSTEKFPPDKGVLVKETGGGDQPWSRFATPTIQVFVRDISVTSARKISNDIFEDLHSRFGLELGTVTVDGVVYPKITTAQIKAIQRPYCIGVDEQGRADFVTNYQFVLDES